MLPGIIAGGADELHHRDQRTVQLADPVRRAHDDHACAHLSSRCSTGEFGTASALSTILLAATGLAVFVVFRISDRKESAFV